MNNLNKILVHAKIIKDIIEKPVGDYDMAHLERFTAPDIKRMRDSIDSIINLLNNNINTQQNKS
jgi:hypothetical protein